MNTLQQLCLITALALSVLYGVNVTQDLNETKGHAYNACVLAAQFGCRPADFK